MKKLFLIIIVLLTTTSIFAQSNVVSGTAKGLTASGLTGIITTPSARIGWESQNFGLDTHFSFFYRPSAVYVPAVTFSIMRMAEVAVAMEFDENDVHGLFVNGKFQFYKNSGASLAAGANLELFFRDNQDATVSSCAFFIATYSGNFFTMPAVTSVVFGWQYLENDNFSLDFNFSMGFEMGLFPSIFKDYLFWITDFGNHSYAYQPSSGINSANRGALNTGFRVDILKKQNLKLQVDVLGTDLLDDERGFLASITFGAGF